MLFSQSYILRSTSFWTKIERWILSFLFFFFLSYVLDFINNFMYLIEVLVEKFASEVIVVLSFLDLSLQTWILNEQLEITIQPYSSMSFGYLEIS